MKIKISKKILEKYPKLNIGFVTAKNLDNNNNNEISERIRDIEERTRKNISNDIGLK